MSADFSYTSPALGSVSTDEALLTPVRESSQRVRPEETVTFLGLEYLHSQTADGGDLYLTRLGTAVAEYLEPENWYEAAWFTTVRERLPGTSAIFRVPTHTVHGVRLNLVVRFSRVGQDVPLDRETLWRFPNAEFNSPFEEFAVAMQLRETRFEPEEPRILTKAPLAIYSPAEKVPLWQSGRLEDKIGRKLARHPDVPLDIHRPYLLVYAWIEGINAAEFSDQTGFAGARRERFLTKTTLRVVSQLARHRFRVIDMKPEHIIFPKGFAPQPRDTGTQPYALVDYELLERF